MLLTHQGSGVVNFAFGAMATWAGYVYADLRRGAYPFPIPGLPERYHFADDVGFWPSILLALATAAVLSLIVHLLVFRPLAQAPALANIITSIGLVVVIISLIDRRFADNAGFRVGPILPREPVTIMTDVTVPRDGLWLAGLVVAIAAAVWIVQRFTRLGLVVRAAAERKRVPSCSATHPHCSQRAASSAHRCSVRS